MAATIFPDNPSIGDRTFDQRYEWNGTKWVYLPPPQIPGDNGWTPVFAIETDGARRVLKVVDWLDGEGTKPNINVYVAVGGFTSVLADAVDIRGPAGVTGGNGLQGDQGVPGIDGRGIDSITRTSGTGEPGTNDTYTILFTDATSTTFVVHNGADGVGSGDMSKSTYDTDDDGKVNAADTADSVPWAGVTGKGGKDLSTEDYTTAEKNKLAGIATGATANSSDAVLVARTNHTGTQAIATVSGLQDALDAKAPLTGGGTSGTWPINVSGNAATASNLSANRTNWDSGATGAAVVGQLGWRMYGNNHTIFDASNSLDPTGATAVNTTNAVMPWIAGYPSLMGWNGTQTYGLRVDSARIADTSNGASAQWVSAAINSNVSQSVSGASAEIRNNSGTGDGGVAALAFHCVGTYRTKLHLRSDGFFGFGGDSRVAWGWYLDASNNMVVSGNVSAYSDPRLKENFQRVSDPFAILNNLDGGTFTWRHGFPHVASKAGQRDYGILADQVQAVMPEIVTESIDIDNEKYLTVSYEKLVPVLIEAVRELNMRVKELEKT